MSTSITTPQLPKSYDPGQLEPILRKAWSQASLGHGPTSLAEGQASYGVLLPPPNVTAILHLGHALNATVQDVLVRHARMRGLATMWMPGTDHAGIATQTAVERRLLLKGKRRTDFTREAFIDIVQAWKDECGATILTQLQEIGSSCDWQRTRFTMDPVCAAAVREAFFRLFDANLIIRGKRLVNWDPATQTALADDEVEMEEVDGHMYYLRYPLSDGSGHVTVATTRPETMLGDTAVAINPADPRAADLRGKTVLLPIVGREIPLVEDEYVVMPHQENEPKAEFATGFLKVTPAHDPNDWDIGQRHELPVINVMGPDGSISARHGWEDVSDEARGFVGMSREDARTAITDWFRQRDLLEEIRDYRHSVGHSYRSHVPIEPYLSDQWFVRVTDDRLRGEAMRAMVSDQYEGEPPRREAGTHEQDGQLRFFPERYAKTFQRWHENLRDWCISRQLWWGHRIPVWSKLLTLAEAGHPDASLGDGMMDDMSWCTEPFCTRSDAGLSVRLQVDRKAGEVRVLACVGLGQDPLEQELAQAGFLQDEDVLDTWFSSALWPISTMGWPDPKAFPETEGLLDIFNPSFVLCTAREIITLWVSRMVMFNRYFRGGTLPFTQVYIHPIIQDGFGQKMSKSLGNGVDPRDIIESHGADALRFAMAQLATSTQDVKLPLDLVCPHTEQPFDPEYIKTAAGHDVLAPIQKSPGGGGREMVTVHGVMSGAVEATEARPLARNSSSKFDAGRAFANKFWNAARFALSRSGSPEPVEDLADLSLVDRWMLSRIDRARREIDQALGNYQFSVCADLLYDLVWRDFCDWYLESIKPTISEDPRQRQVLLTALHTITRLLHPVCPFVTEALWSQITAAGEAGVPGLELAPSELVATAAWPDTAALENTAAESTFETIKQLVNAIRKARASHGVPHKAKLTLAVTPRIQSLLEPVQAAVMSMCQLEAIEPIAGDAEDGIQVHFEHEVLSLQGHGAQRDAESERQQLEDRVTQLARSIAALQGRLNNPGYVQKAPAHLVAESQADLANAESAIEVARQALEHL